MYWREVAPSSSRVGRPSRTYQPLKVQELWFFKMLGYVKLPAAQYNINTSETLNLAQKLGFVWLYFPLCMFSLQLIMY